MKLYPDSKIYIIAPRDLFTGGPLSLHQLGATLRQMNFDVQMMYLGTAKTDVHPRLKVFNLPIAHEIEENPKNILIIPETASLYVNAPPKVQIVVWWMSVNYHLYRLHDWLHEFFNHKSFAQYPAPTHNLFRLFEYDHIYQSEYARQFLKINEVPDDKILHELRGYISKSFYDNESKIDLSLKENLIVYNPKKGMAFTKKLIEYAPELNFVPIENMTADEVQQLLAKSKIYIDFGYHPGKERIPRESTLSHCVVVTNRQGSAGNDIDVPIPDDFKFDDTDENIPNIIAKLKYIFDNFEAEHNRQNSYRDEILVERDKFFRDVKEIFQVNTGLKIYDNTKIYVFAPINNYTGGPESLHQFCSNLRRLNLDAYMVYLGNENEPVHPMLRKYHLPFVQNFEDNPKNIVIVPETTSFVKKLKSQVVIWWLSVDFYFKTMQDAINEYMQNSDFLRMKSPVYDAFKDPDIYHFYQCEYVHQFLQVNQVSDDKMFSVKDYVPRNFLKKSAEIDLSLKDNLIAYNPAKGFEFTKKLIKYAKNLKFVPIQNMTRDQVQKLLSRAKIYIDFGNHPGRDRIPREAALSHCVIVTNRRGSAGNGIDVPIPDDFKFDDTEENIPTIVKKLQHILKHFQAEHDKQNSYRNMILQDPDKIFEDVKNIFKDKSQNKNVALVGNLDDIEKMYYQLKNESDVDIVFLVNDEYAGNVAEFEDKEIEIISEDDALFLFDERRIDEFIGR